MPDYVICKLKKIQTEMKALGPSQHFPSESQWEYLVAVETRVLIQSAPKHYATFPPT